MAVRHDTVALKLTHLVFMADDDPFGMLIA